MSSPLNRLTEQLKERHFWRVLIAYPSVCFVLLQAVEFFMDNYGLDPRWLTSTIIVAVVLLPAAFLWNWRHGEAGAQAVIRSEVVVYSVSLVSAVAVTAWFWSVSPTAERVSATDAESVPVIRLAVMPFEDQTEDAELQYLGDGIAESLINWLSSVPSIKAISKTASFRSRALADNPKALGEALGADQVIIGRLRMVNGLIEISVSLVDTADESQIWGVQFSESVEDAIYLERSIVAAIRSSLSLASTDSMTNVSSSTNVPAAYKAYQQGHFLIQSTSVQSIEEGLADLRKAVRLDPKFGLPYADVADALSQQIFYGVFDNDQLIGEARSAAYSAVALAPSLPESYTALAAVHQYIDLDWGAADKAYEKAISFHPRNPAPYHRYSDYLWVTLRFQKAQKMARLAMETDPLDSNSMHAVGISYMFNGQFAEAVEAFGEWNRFHPESWWSYVKLAVALSLNGQCDEATGQAARLVDISANQISNLMLSWLAWSYHNCESEALYADAKARLQSLSDQGGDSVDPSLAYYYAIDGQTDSLVRLFENAIDENASFSMFAQVFVPDYLGWSIDLSDASGKAYMALIESMDFPPNDLIP